MNRGGNLESGIQKIEENTGGATTTMNKDFNDTNWKQEILGSLEFNQSKFQVSYLRMEQNHLCRVSILGISIPDARN